MATYLTECPKCHYTQKKSDDFKILNPDKLDKPQILVKVETECPECSHRFTFSTLSNYGKQQRDAGRILI